MSAFLRHSKYLLGGAGPLSAVELVSVLEKPANPLTHQARRDHPVMLPGGLLGNVLFPCRAVPFPLSSPPSSPKLPWESDSAQSSQGPHSRLPLLSHHCPVFSSFTLLIKNCPNMSIHRSSPYYTALFFQFSPMAPPFALLLDSVLWPILLEFQSLGSYLFAGMMVLKS